MTKQAHEAARQFDFLEGEWDADCQFPKPEGTWGQGQGVLRATKVLAPTMEGRPGKSTG